MCSASLGRGEDGRTMHSGQIPKYDLHQARISSTVRIDPSAETFSIGGPAITGDQNIRFGSGRAAIAGRVRRVDADSESKNDE